MELIKNSTFNYDNANFAFNTYQYQDEFYFRGKEVALALGYTNTQQAIIKNVNSDDKTSLKDLVGPSLPEMAKNIDQKAIFINESGLYSLILSSKLPQAKQFKQWVTKEILPSIRKTGEYKLQTKQITSKKVFKIENEHDLHTKVVNYLKVFEPDIIINASVGESHNNKLDSWYQGYQKGIPDLQIYEAKQGFHGMHIEFKSPTGKGELSVAQEDIITKLQQKGYKVLVSNDYDMIIREINNYLHPRTKTIRSCRFKCNRCGEKFNKRYKYDYHYIRHFY